MSADTENTRDSFADQLASFDDRLQSNVDDVDMLADIQQGIGALLESGGGSEAEIRRLLQERYESGALRKETFQLVKSMLDGYGTEKVPTSPAVSPSPPPPPVTAPAENEDSFGATTVIPKDILPINDAGMQVQVGSVLRDRFLLQERVSGGSMGVVYKALDRRLAEAGSDQPYVAVKILSPELAEDGHALRALQQEAAKTRCLVHPNIVRFIDLDRDDDLYFLVLEWLDGRSLADILDSPDARSIDKDAAFRITRQVGEALDYAHRCGIVHADVKPGNIMIMPNGDAKLYDFGVARVRQKHPDSDFDPGILGALTPAYSSMQVLGGEDPVATDDVFSLGCLMYRLVTGYRVFGPRNAAEASAAGMTPQRPQGVNDEQWSALRKALSNARVTRFKSVKEFIDALDTSADETITLEAPERFVTDDSDGSPGYWMAVVVVLLGALGIGAQQMGYLDPWLAKFTDSEQIVEVAAPETLVEDPAVDEVIVEELVTDPIAEFDAADPAATEETGEGTTEIEVTEALRETMAEPVQTQDLVLTVPLIDFSTLPPPAAIINFALDGSVANPTRVVLREDGDPVAIDFIRAGDFARPLTLRLEEVGFSGNRSPWATGEYALSNAGLVAFPVGHTRTRVTLTTASDVRSEADQQSTLRLRLADTAESELAIVNVIIEDDDRRAFENRLPVNTVGFGASQVSVSEADPAVQIDVMRFNPDDTSIVVGFSVEGHTATEGEDYFAPGNYSISFGPGQRSTRILIPLVQDSRAEGDEAFVVKLEVDLATQPANVSPNIAVMIRDDER